MLCESVVSLRGWGCILWRVGCCICFVFSFFAVFEIVLSCLGYLFKDLLFGVDAVVEEEGEGRADKGTVGGGLKGVGEGVCYGVDAGVDIAVEKYCVGVTQTFEHHV